MLTITDSLPATAERPTVRGSRSARLPRGYAPRMDLYDSLIRGVAQRHSIAPALLKAVCVAESGMNPRAVSHHGALGLMQLMPSTAAALNVEDPFDPGQSLDGGAKYLAAQIARFGDVEQAIAAYNAGPARVHVAGGVPQIPETLAFVAQVMRLYRYFQNEHPLAGEPAS
ncbi:MAG: lytic transglycosylase domain-containing protein [Pseudomonadota bacterium]